MDARVVGSVLIEHGQSNYALPPACLEREYMIKKWPGLYEVLLRDHTGGIIASRPNIIWATDNYAQKGLGFNDKDQITIDKITGSNAGMIVPRYYKSTIEQQSRSRGIAEVFTPSWICNKQNNLVDNAWFGRDGVFNTEIDNPDGSHSWIINTDPIIFPKGKTWRDYVKENRLEITCGEAPYLVSRYDTVTGSPIALEHRIGILDRKLRVAGENTTSSGDWLKATQSAYKSTYGYEWQGDNIILARESLILSFVDYYRAKFGRDPQLKSLLYIAYIISWNIWQMDGLKGVIPNSCGERCVVEHSLFEEIETINQCEGCKTGNIKKHNGTYALIKDWNAPKAKQKIRFIDLIN